MPLIGFLEGHYHVIAAEVDGFTLGSHTHFTSIDDQAAQIARHIAEHHNGKVECIYGLSMGGKILSRLLERGEVEVAHAIMDAAPRDSHRNFPEDEPRRTAHRAPRRGSKTNRTNH